MSRKGSNQVRIFSFISIIFGGNHSLHLNVVFLSLQKALEVDAMIDLYTQLLGERLAVTNQV